MRAIRRIIVHHSLTEDGPTVSWSAIRRYHMTAPEYGFSDIGYHAGIEDVNGTLECFFGRPLTDAGAHTAGHNHDSLGFLFVGNYDAAAPPVAMLVTAARRVLVPWMRLLDIPVTAVLPHSDFAKKSCPGKAFPMETLREILTREL